jgi:competence ComEA-like helix-hairpin-helix protein
MLNRISKKLGITQTEIKIFFFVVVVFIVGLVYKVFFLHTEETPYRVFDYTEEDEKFYSIKTDSINFDSLKNNLSKNDYKNEVLNFSDKNFKQYSKKVTPKEKSLNLNTATFSELVNLPGVGDKTAKGIIDYRNKIKKFTNINQLINVDGIGESKLSKIKKFVYLN